MNQIFSSLAQIEKSGKAAVLCIIVDSKGSTPRKAGSKMLVFSNGSIEGSVGGGKIEFLVIEAALQQMNSNNPKTISYDLGGEVGMQCGGKMTIYFETVQSPPRLFIFGAGHIGKVLAKMAIPFGFQVKLVDDRKEVFQQEVSGVENIHDEFQKALQSIEFRDDDFVVVTTYKHTYDEEITAYILQQKHAYLGMMASKRKASISKEKWLERGINQNLIDSVCTPIGLPMECETPEEIALSITAQLVDRLNKLRKSQL